MPERAAPDYINAVVGEALRRLGQAAWHAAADKLLQVASAAASRPWPPAKTTGEARASSFNARNHDEETCSGCSITSSCDSSGAEANFTSDRLVYRRTSQALDCGGQQLAREERRYHHG